MIIDRLNVLIADHQVLYQKLRNYHWTVSGPFFFQLHAQFEKLYTEVAQHVDDLAERVVALGGRPLGTYKAALERTRLQEDDLVPLTDHMVRNIIADLERITPEVRGLATAFQDQDRGTADILDDIGDAEEKGAWMLRAFLGAQVTATSSVPPASSVERRAQRPLGGREQGALS